MFWEDKSEVLESDHRCFKAHYPATLKSFFIDLGVSEQASQRDYACRIQEIATTEQAADKKVRERLRRLYKFLTSEWQKDEWKKIIYDDKCWLGKRGKEWGFFTRQELVLKDHPHIGEIFEGEVPFWTFDDDLSSLASTLKIEGCSQAQLKSHPEGDPEEDPDWSERVRNLHPYIYAFLKSPRLSEEPEKEKLAGVLEQVSVCRVKEVKGTYNLKGIPVPDPDPRLSFLDVSDQEAKLWLGLEVNEIEYAELIGDALQAHFDIKELGRFVEDLLTPTKKRDRVLFNWKRKGLDTKFLNEDPKDNEEKQIEALDEKRPDVPNSEDVDPAVDESNMRIPTDNEDHYTVAAGVDDSGYHFSNDGSTDATADGYEVETPMDSEEPEIGKVDSNSTLEDSETLVDLPSDMETLTTTRISTTQTTDDGSEHEIPEINENPKIGSGDPNSTTKGSGTGTYNPFRTSRTSRSGGHSLNTSNNRESSGGGHGGSGGGGEGQEHENLKKDLANNPSQLGEGLELIKIEYTFGSGDRVDVLLKDSSENPVTVEVETGFSSGTGRYVGVWQAVKYQHLAAMKYGLPCQEVRSILAAPEIPEDVKKKCEELGIEPIEVSQE